MTQFTKEYWQETASSVQFFPSVTSPDLPVTAVKIYVFQGHKLLLTQIKTRGWDIPGGHIEIGETAEQAVVRELQEETGGSVDRFKLIGYLKVINEEENEHNRQYPKVSCILVYKGVGLVLDHHHEFQLEASAGKLVPRNELLDVHHDWNEHKSRVVEYAANCPV